MPTNLRDYLAHERADLAELVANLPIGDPVKDALGASRHPGALAHRACSGQDMVSVQTLAHGSDELDADIPMAIASLLVYAKVMGFDPDRVLQIGRGCYEAFADEVNL